MKFTVAALAVAVCFPAHADAVNRDSKGNRLEVRGFPSVTPPILGVLPATAIPRAQRPQAPPGLKDSVPIYLSSGGNAVMMDVILGGQPARMQIDTGAGVMLINSDLAYRIVDGDQGSWDNAESFRMADGRIVTSPTITINSVRIGTHEVKQVKAAVSNGRISLLMSFPALDSIGPFTINTRTQELIFDTSVVTTAR